MTPSSIKRFFAACTEPDPSRDWLIALALAGITFIALLAYAAYLFVSIGSGAVFSGPAAPPPQIPVTRGEIEETLASYQSRQVNYAAHNVHVPPLVDPSK